MKTNKLRLLTFLLALAMVAMAFVACDADTDLPGDTTTTAADTTTGSQPSDTGTTAPEDTGTTSPDDTGTTTPEDTGTTAPDAPDVMTRYPEVADEEVYQDREYDASKRGVYNRVKADGRTQLMSNGIAIDWSAAALEFRAECMGAVSLSIHTSNTVKFKVFVDGEQTKELSINGNVTETVVENLEEGIHTVRLLRITMVESSNVGVTAELTGIQMTGVMLNKPLDKDYYIEFLGDSVTCGVGTKSASDGYAYADDSFAYQTAKELDADYSVVAISGIGTLKGTSRHGTNNIYTHYKYINSYRNQNRFENPDRQADLIVIATNANDSDGTSAWDFKQHIKALIERAQDAHGDGVKFIWVFDMYTPRPNLNKYVQEVFEELGGEAAGFYTVSFYVDKTGGSEHPIAKAHDDYTDILVDFIEEKNILN